MHPPLFYVDVAPAACRRAHSGAAASRMRWACTIMAAIIHSFWSRFLWVLLLFPAQPKLGPVYDKVTHFVPPAFPLLLLVPGVRARFNPPTDNNLAADRSRAGRGCGISRRLHRGAMAVLGIPDDAARP